MGIAPEGRHMSGALENLGGLPLPESSEFSPAFLVQALHELSVIRRSVLKFGEVRVSESGLSVCGTSKRIHKQAISLLEERVAKGGIQIRIRSQLRAELRIAIE